jgi:hypothetical protein
VTADLSRQGPSSLTVDAVWRERFPTEYDLFVASRVAVDPLGLVPDDWDRRALLPWSLPRGLYYATPWAWVRVYLRAGDWLAWRLWWASRRVVWAIEDGAGGSEDRVVAFLRWVLRRGPEVSPRGAPGVTGGRP